MSRKSRIIVDVSEIIKIYNNHKALRSILKHVPVAVIIDAVFSIRNYIDYSDAVYDLLDSRLEYCTEEIDLDLLSIVIESIVTDVDETILRFIDPGVNDCYMLERWVGDSSIVIEVYL